MSDFANASMIALINRQLARSHPELLTVAKKTDAIRKARIPAEHKRDFLNVIWQKAGPLPLLSTGQNIADVSSDPVWHGAVRNSNPGTVFDKWRRFEIFGHSRNRLKIDYDGANFASCERYAVHGVKPTTPENLLICGLIIALLELNGCQNLICKMTLTDGTWFTIRDQNKFIMPEKTNSLATTNWTLEWQGFNSKEELPTNDLILPTISFPENSSAQLRQWVGAVVAILARDLTHPWKVAGLAATLNISKRSFQRRLACAELSFSQLVRLVRIHEACHLLRNKQYSITTIGFCAGFSDSAHFSRDFRASIGMSPIHYRNITRN